MSLLQHTALAIVIFTTLWWLAGLALAGAYRGARAPMQRLPPAARVRALTALAALPAALAGATTLALYLPVARELVVSTHCHAGLGCGAHAPALANGPAQWLIAALALVIAAASVWRLARPLHRNHERARQLRALSTPAAGGSYRCIDTDTAFAVAVGLWRPQVFVSRGLLDKLAPAALSSVLLHEEAHAQRRDGLRLLAVAAAAPAALVGTGRPLMADLRNACEQSCDQHAARAEADPLRVADALLRARRAARSAPSNRGGKRDGALSARIAALIAPTPATATVPAPLALIGLGLAALLTLLWGVDAVHHGAELLQQWKWPTA